MFKTIKKKIKDFGDYLWLTQVAAPMAYSENVPYLYDYNNTYYLVTDATFFKGICLVAERPKNKIPKKIKIHMIPWGAFNRKPNSISVTLEGTGAPEFMYAAMNAALMEYFDFPDLIRSRTGNIVFMSDFQIVLDNFVKAVYDLHSNKIPKRRVTPILNKNALPHNVIKELQK